MEQTIFKVRVSPLEIQEQLEKNLHEELVFSDSYDLGNGKFILILVYNKYYMRTSSDIGLVIVCENTTGKTLIKITVTGSGAGVFSIDWGAGGDFIKRVEDVISEYII